MLDPVGNALFYVVDFLVAQFLVEETAHDTGTIAGTADEYERIVLARYGRQPVEPRLDIVASAGIEKGDEMASLHHAGLPPLLGTTDVDHGNPLFHQRLELLIVDLGHLGLCRQHECRPQQHCHEQSMHFQVPPRKIRG